ncbi:50S ribosomal protein L30 [Anaeromyxobacter paludicola]|uniref:50S ribosomal protein L30 n=1 Tax=Anaeromyxobacter paludicola TaxID=2918171 RepID=A0ABM7X6R9_9BACT|nr:50S ribosomal protein L30 [Anaeromyxobacter paludicola]BDG07515.1 50S ribosomal protein L30 [Anaeromyxobacter paludicola]
MAAIKVKLVRGLAGCPAPHRVTVQGLGLKKTNSTKLLPDTPATMGMIEKVKYLIEWERVDEAPPARRTAKKKKEA